MHNFTNKIYNLKKVCCCSSSNCKKDVDAENISTHKKCMSRPFKSSESSAVVLLQKWHYHKHQAAETEVKQNTLFTKIYFHKKIVFSNFIFIPKFSKIA